MEPGAPISPLRFLRLAPSSDPALVCSFLDRLRPDYLKVDASVVRGIDRNLVKQEIFATIARQGGAIGAHVVAVGVESAEEASTVRALGTTYAQGYHFASPAPRERWVS